MAPGTKDSDLDNDGLRSRPKKDRYWIKMPVFIFTFGLVAIIMVLMMNRIRHGQHRNTLLIHSVQSIEVEASLFHLWLEEYLTGDRSITVEDIMSRIDRALKFSEGILDGDETEFGQGLDPEDRLLAESIKERIAYLKEMGNARLVARNVSGVNSLIDNAFDQYFYETLTENKALVSRLVLKNKTQAERADTVVRVIIALLIVIMFSTVGGFFRIKKKQREAEAEIRESEQEFRVLFDSLSDAVFLCNDDFILDCNPCALELFGADSVDQLVRKSFLDFSPKIQEEGWGSRVLLMENISKAFKAGRSTFEFKLQKLDGTEFYADISFTSIKLRRRDLIQAVVRDITERKTMLMDLERLATVDTLTQAYNRTKFDELIVMEIERSRRFRHALSLLMFDLDNFKSINDTYGHTVGDIVLKRVSDIVRGHMRRTNHFIRWGGEEFIVIAIETDLEGAVGLAERIRGEVAAHEYETVESVTISFGVTQLRNDDTTMSLIKRVDDALYMAKEAGRNRVESI
ncbi:MAG: sensor domain-containing diguanylate cyclase [Thermodesulfobacteriota bacterium]